jgi:AhpD family alkylhydroperoxidase
MQPRASYQKAAPDVLQGMLALSTVVRKSGLAPGLVDLICYRVSQINGCAFCLDMHSKDLRARGETEQRIYMLSAWREASNLYSARERASLAWAEAVTSLKNQEVPDEVYSQAREEFSETEIAQLTLAVIAINGWNRLNIAFHTPAGHYKSTVVKQSAA